MKAPVWSSWRWALRCGWSFEANSGKCLWSTNAVRATNEEKAGVELVEQFLPDLKESLKKKQRRNEYWDLSPEGPPTTQEEASTAAPTPASTRPTSTTSTPAASTPTTPRASSTTASRSAAADIPSTEATKRERDPEESIEEDEPKEKRTVHDKVVDIELRNVDDDPARELVREAV